MIHSFESKQKFSLDSVCDKLLLEAITGSDDPRLCYLMSFELIDHLTKSWFPFLVVDPN